MTTYSPVADSEIDPESPATTSLFTKLRNNPIAIMEKASGAPVLANDYIVENMIKDGEITSRKFAGVSAGVGIISEANTLRNTSNTSYVKVKEITCPVQGTYTVDFSIYTNNGAAPAYGRIYVNGVAVGSQRSTGSITAVTFSESITISGGDLIQIYYHTTGANVAYISSFKLKIGSGGVESVVLLD